MSFEEERYSELRRVARSLCRRERFSLTLQPSALVHEAFLRLRNYKGAQTSIAAAGRRAAVETDWRDAPPKYSRTRIYGTCLAGLARSVPGRRGFWKCG